ncbi:MULTISPECIES: hypothetical protein [Actinoalloteichus]|nr:hypothetical protein [Actinoalloteichus caeruleus]
MRLFSRRRRQAGPEEMVLGHPYDDTVLDAAVETGSLVAARTVLEECRDDHETRALRTDVLGRAFIGRADEIAEAASATGDPELWLLAGSVYRHEAWTVRGDGVAEDVGHDRYQIFFATLRKAVAPLHEAAAQLPEDPCPWMVLVCVGQGLQVDREQQDEVWSETVLRSPTLYPAHWYRVQALAAKWGGSHEASLRFARETVARAPAGHPLTAVLPLAHFEVYLHNLEETFRARRRVEYFRIHTRYFEDNAGELVDASDKWSRDPVPHPRAREAHNLFAAALSQAGDLPRTRRHLLGMEDRLHPVPWAYLGDPEQEYRRTASRYLLT